MATQPLADSEPDAVPPRASRRRLWVRALVPVVAVAVVGAAVSAASGDSAADDETATSVPTRTAQVETRQLAQRLTLDGALTYAGAAELSGGASGTVTSLPAVGATVGAGQALWRVDNVPVPLMLGALPQWRRFDLSMTNGDDVRQLEQNLRRLGHDPGNRVVVDTDFTAATAAAVRRWQKSIGRPVTGVVEMGDLVFYPTPVRVTEHVAGRGAQVAPGAPIVKVSQTRRVVAVELDARRQNVVRAGRTVQVELPDGKRVAGKITSVGSVATSEGDAAATVDVVVDLVAGAALPPLDQAPVEVLVELQSKKALAVPVKALLALTEGGYAVEVVESGRRRLLAVETGMFADGYVEVRGEGVREGLTVTVPR